MRIKTALEILEESRKANPKFKIEFIKKENERYYFESTNSKGTTKRYSVDQYGYNRIGESDIQKNKELQIEIDEMKQQQVGSSHHLYYELSDKIRVLEYQKVKAYL